MMKYGLTSDELNYIHKRIKMPPIQEQAISAAGSKICNVLLRGNLNVAGILWSGSFVRQTKWRSSDLDTVFWTGSPKDPKNLKEKLVKLFQSNFPRAEVESGKQAVHVNFPGSNPVEVDVVYSTQAHVIKEKQLNARLYELPKVKKEAAMLVCYALQAVLGKKIRSYEVSFEAFRCVATILLDLVIELVTFFEGRIIQAGFTLNQVFQELHRDRFDKVFFVE